ncbi:MAG: Nodulation protein NolT [Chlamydiae bacterium]|nr:Nodulation protein NolT [Chlamydiota bacterium]
MVRRAHLMFLVLLALLVAGCATQTAIVTNVEEREANEIVVLLASKGVDAAKIPTTVTTTGTTAASGWDIAVPASQITEALAILNKAGLPRTKGTTLLDLFGAATLVPSDLQDQIRFQEGLSEQLGNTIRKMDGIIDADVQITFPQDDEGETAYTASVYVKHRGVLDNPNSLMVTKIKRLVSSALPGLTIENVSVVADRALISDIALQTYTRPEDLKEYVSIWSVVIAKDSAARFRIIFYAFIFLLFILACALAWFIWKCLPIIQQQGGIKSLYYPQQYTTGVVAEEEAEEKKEEEGEG